MRLREVFATTAMLFVAAVVLGAFARAAVNTYNGDGFSSLAIAAVLFALAWVAGKIENRNNKDSV